MTSKKMDIWDKVSKTDPVYTKEYSGPGGYSGTSINGEYLVMKATEMFGPVGIGWGYEIIEERYDTGGIIDIQEDHEIRSMTHTLRVKLWYLHEGQRGEVEHFGHTPYVYRTRSGAMTDPEAPKKSLTDALKKCLSMLGFSADVWLGQYDDVNYVEAMSEEFGIRRAEDSDEETKRLRDEYLAKMEKYVRQMQKAVTASELNALYKEAVRKAGYRKDDRMVKRLTEVRDEALAAFKSEEVKPKQEGES